MKMLGKTYVLRIDTIPQHIGGITCDARNCLYHDGEGYCTAEHVNIGSMFAVNALKTYCSTFKARGEMLRKY